MAEKRLSGRLFRSYLALILLALVALGWLANQAVEGFYYREKLADLKTRATLFSQQIAGENIHDQARLQAICQSQGKATATRITLISATGQVLGDSHQDPDLMDIHADRPEIRSAYKGQPGTAFRYSHTVGEDMLYLALPVEVAGETLVVRTALPQRVLEEALASLRLRILGTGTIVLVVAAGLGWVVTRRSLRPLEEIQRGAELFAQGEFEHRVRIPESPGFGPLAETMNRIAAQLDERIQTLLRQRNEQEAILSSMVESVLAVDREGTILRINSAAGELLQVDPEAVIGKPIQEAVRNSDMVSFTEELLAGGGSQQREIRLAGEQECYLQSNGARLQGTDGETIGGLVVLNDITHLKRLETIRKDFVANVSHELKTPVTSILGFVDTLQESALEDPEKARQQLGIVARQSERLNRIIDDLLELSRIEGLEEKDQIELERQALKVVIEDVIQSFSISAGEKQIPIELSCEDSLQARLNPTLFSRALANLIDNAIKYSQAGKPVRIQAHQDGGEAVLVVEDQGPGIAGEHLPRLFERFYRVDKGRNRELGGSGLGLAIVKHIIQAHHGSVEVSSQLGEGSRFTIRLPA